MNFRENVLAILNYKPYDALPIVSFGYWDETLEKWRDEGHVTQDEVEDYHKNGDNGAGDRSVMKKLGFDFNWNSCVCAEADLFPNFEVEVIEERSDGTQILRDEKGLIVQKKVGTVSIPAEIGTSLTDRAAWETQYLPRMQWDDKRIDKKLLQTLVDDTDRAIPVGLHCGSLMGTMRNFLGMQHLSYMYADDEDLFIEIANQFAMLSFETVKATLESGAKFDYAHYWEDICFKNGPLVIPDMFDELIGPHYKRTSDLLNSYGIDIISVDCDGLIDSLIPTWINNGVNTMFPIEVGTWHASIAPWREKYGKQLRGVGGMDKKVFAGSFSDIDSEIERLIPLIDLGGFIPCPDHRIPPDAKFENVQYYCERLRKRLSK